MKKYPEPKIIKNLLNPEKYQGDPTNIVCRSSWETKFVKWCDRNPSVLKYASEEFSIPYYSQADQKWRRYFVDFVIQLKQSDGNIKNFLIEIKPEQQTRPPKQGKKKTKTYLKEVYDWQVNNDKWNAAEQFAKDNNMEFIVLNEYDLGISKRKC